MMMLYKKLVSEGTWPLTLSASVKGRSTAQQCQDRMFQLLLVFTLKHLSVQFIFYNYNVTELQYGTEYGVIK